MPTCIMSLTLVRHDLLEQQKTFKDKTGSYIPEVTYCSEFTMYKNKCSNISKQKSSYVPKVDCGSNVTSHGFKLRCFKLMSQSTQYFLLCLMNGDEKWFVCLLNLVELFTITVFVHTVGIADHHCLNFLFLCT